MVEKGNQSILSGYVFNRDDNSVISGGRINLTMPPLEKLMTTEIKENGYFEIGLQKGKYTIEVVQGTNVLFSREGLKIPTGRKVEVLIYLKNRKK